MIRRAALILSMLVSVALARFPTAAGPPLTVDDIAGMWSAELSHAGETTRVVLHVEKSADGRLVAKWSTPVIHLWEMPVGIVTVDGETARIGSFVLTYDRSARTLTGTIPRAIVPVYSINAVFHRAENVSPTPRQLTAAPAPAPLWTFDAGSPIWSDLETCDGLVIVGDDGGRVRALADATGRLQWTFAAGAPVRARATCVGDAAFVHADDGSVTKLEARTGTPKWKVRVDAQPIARLALDDPRSRYDNHASAVAIRGEHAYVGTSDGRMVALDAATGARLWEFSARDSIVGAPLVDGGRVFFGSFDGRVYAVDAASGTEVWNADTGAAVTTTPASFNQKIIVGSRSYDLTAFDALTGAAVWNRYFWFSWVESTATIFKSMLYIGSSDAARVSAIDPSNGHQRWTADVGGSAWGQPAVTGDRVLVAVVGVLNYLPEHRGGAVSLDRRTGRTLWRFGVDAQGYRAQTAVVPYGFAASPALSGGRVYFAGLDGRVYAFTP